METNTIYFALVNVFMGGISTIFISLCAFLFFHYFGPYLKQSPIISELFGYQALILIIYAVPKCLNTNYAHYAAITFCVMFNMLTVVTIERYDRSCYKRIDPLPVYLFVNGLFYGMVSAHYSSVFYAYFVVFLSILFFGYISQIHKSISERNTTYISALIPGITFAAMLIMIGGFVLDSNIGYDAGQKISAFRFWLIGLVPAVKLFFNPMQVLGSFFFFVTLWVVSSLFFIELYIKNKKNINTIYYLMQFFSIVSFLVGFYFAQDMNLYYLKLSSALFFVLFIILKIYEIIHTFENTIKAIWLIVIMFGLMLFFGTYYGVDDLVSKF
jgi:hypothetical protein